MVISVTADTVGMATTAHMEEYDNDWRRFRSVFPEFKDATIANLRQLRDLEAGWDGASGLPIDQVIIDAAIHLIDQLPEYIAQRPLVAPLSEGQLQIEWHRGNKVLEFEFESESTVHYLKYDPDINIAEEGEMPTSDLEAATDHLVWFMEQHHHE